MAPPIQAVCRLFSVVTALSLLLIILLMGGIVVHMPVSTNTLRFAAQKRGLFVGAVVAVQPLEVEGARTGLHSASICLGA